MASRARKRGKAVEEPVIEDKENIPSRGRTGRIKKIINYAEDSPSPVVNKKKGKEKAKIASRQDKNEIQLEETKPSQKNKSSKDADDVNPTKSKLPSKTKGKKKNKEEEPLEPAVKPTGDIKTTENDIEKDTVQTKTASKTNNKLKQNKKTKEVVPNHKENEKVHAVEKDPKLDTSGITHKTSDKRRGKSIRKETTDIQRKPLGNRNDNTEDNRENNIEPDVTNKKSSKIQKNECTEIIVDKETESKSKDRHHDPSDDPTENDITVSDNIQCSNKKTRTNANNTFTKESVPETPVMTKSRTPGRTTQLNTPSSEHRVQQVKENLRNSLCGTPSNSAHPECTYKMSQVYEILELVTQQLTDMMSEMETVKSSNEQMKTEMETTRSEYRRLKDEMNNVKNTAMNQNSPTTQNEIDLLWKQCDSQKKTIRTLHEEVDNAKLELNKKFEKYKKAMVFILCKTRPEVKHSDVSKLRNLLGKAEEHLDLTLDEICSTMEADLPVSPSNNKYQVVPNVSCPVITCTDTSKNEQSESIDQQEEGGRKRNVSACEKSTPKRTRNSLEAFQPRHRIKRTPVANPP